MNVYAPVWQRRFLVMALISVVACKSQSPSNRTLRQILPLAQKGDAESQYQLGMLYKEGSPETPKDPVRAVDWFRRSAEQGNAQAENALGIAFQHGYGVTRDDVVGFDWLYKAALKGNAPAQHNLALAYHAGQGTLKSESEAFTWFLESARNGQASSQARLCAVYQQGNLGVAADPTMAYAWCLIAATTAKQPAQIKRDKDSSG